MRYNGDMTTALWTPTLVTAPAAEVLSLADIRSHLALDESSQQTAPPIACTATLASPAAAGNVDAGAHRYAVTFVTADGETEMGPVSGAVTVASSAVNGQVSLTGIPTGGSDVTGRKIYRTTAGGSLYLLLTTLANNSATTYTDNTADSGLGAQAPTANGTLDPMLVRLRAVARRQVEADCGLALITQTRKFTADCIPARKDGGRIFVQLPVRPLQSASLTITYQDSNGTTQTWSSSEYDVSGAGTAAVFPEIAPKSGYTWPTLGAGKNLFSVQGVFGYGASGSDVPAELQQAQLLMVEHLYNNRGATSPGLPISVTPMGYESLISGFRAHRY